jgi:transposase InsO family protein
VLHYHTDNGVFTAAEFHKELADNKQGLTLSGVGAHHQNAMAERSIGVLFNMARTMMLHAKLRWPKAVTAKLWPMALKHAEYLVNHVPAKNHVCPMDLIQGSHIPRDHLRNLHVWGAPAYVLHPKLQDGSKIPKWDPRSRQGLHLGWSPLHASSVPLVLNLTTGHVSPQFHVVFDDWFTTVSTEEKGVAENLNDAVWTELFMDNRFLAYFDDDDPMELDDEWLSDYEQLHKRDLSFSDQLRNLEWCCNVGQLIQRISTDQE